MIFTVVPSWWVVVILVSLLVLLVYFDFVSRPSKNRWIRLVMIILGLVSLLFLYVQPAIEVDRPSLAVAIVGAGSEETTLDSLVENEFRLAKTMQEYQALSESFDIKKLVVTGNGLPMEDLNQLNGSFEYIPSKMEHEGPIELNTGSIIADAPAQLSFRLFISDSVTVTLSGTGIDPISVRTGSKNTAVSFEVVPSVTGKLTWQLFGIRNQDTIFSEVVPIEVKEKSKPAVLMIANAPSFEFRFLKNYLAESGFGIAEKIQVSKDVFRDAFTNVEKRPLTPLTPKKLEEFSLLVLDAAAYTSLSQREQNHIKSKLRLGEIGLVWMNNSVANDLIATTKVTSVALEFSFEERAVSLKSSDKKLNNPDYTLILEKNVIGEITEYGLGKIVMPKIAESYTSILKGSKKLYAGIWQKLLQPVIGTRWQDVGFSAPTFPRTGERTIASIFTDEMPEIVMVDSIRVAAKQLWYQPEKWEMEFWPVSRGWNSVSVQGQGNHFFFVFDNDDWTAQRTWKQREQTNAISSLNNDPKNQSGRFTEPISQWYFFFAFLFSFSYLWVEQRLC
ncbi:MAG: hypothetical protein RIM99_11925 [Cyclobacteriaceae bacterium]